MSPEHLHVTRSSADTLPAGPGGGTSEVPTRLLRQAARRLQVVCWIVIAITVFTWFGVNVIEGDIAHELRTPQDWVPPVTGLVVAVAVLLAARSRRLSPSTIVTIGLVFEVGTCYFMAYGQYWNTFHGISGERLTADLLGVSPVALWMAFFTVLVPAPPRRVLMALLFAGAAVPLTILHLIRTGNAPAPPPMDFFFIFVLPYIVTVIMCLIAARIIYGLGREVRRAEQMGSYRLLERIGRGGMGEVWKARHDLLARPAAIKLIRPDALGSDEPSRRTAVARFEQEAQATAGLQSHHTVELYDFGVSEDGSFYYVMEHLEGQDLDTLVKRHGPVPPERAVHLLRQVCLSLGEAHRRGLIHRDIKPSNLVLGEHAFEPDFVKVLDFGLVKRFAGADRDPDGGVLTRAEAIAGTPAFLAPEIATGKGVIDGRADLYSLGCVGFWLLTGRLVFDEESPMAMIVAHSGEAPPRPGLYAEIPVPPELDALILACLAKDPADRPETTERMIELLDAVPLDRPWTPERARAWWDAHRPDAVRSPEPI